MTISLPALRKHDPKLFRELDCALPEGWRIEQEGSQCYFVLDMAECLAASQRDKPIVRSERHLTPDERAQFVCAKRKELRSFFSNDVWEFASASSVDYA